MLAFGVPLPIPEGSEPAPPPRGDRLLGCSECDVKWMGTTEKCFLCEREGKPSSQMLANGYHYTPTEETASDEND